VNDPVGSQWRKWDLHVHTPASLTHEYRSWDEFLVPAPFARAVLCFGEPIWVPPDADREAVEAGRKLLEERLLTLTWQADRLVAG
jgi:lysophospholipid acyltransferase (LPLAT)-like uncharacterized protein